MVNFVFREAYSYSYVALNQSDEPIEITLDAKKESKDMEFLPRSGKVSKIILPGEMEFMMHAIADPNAETFTKKVNVSHRSLA